MKNLKMSVAAMLLLTVTFMNAQDGHNHDKMKMGDKKMEQMDHSKMQANKDAKAEMILSDYFNLKEALVADDAKKAAEASSKLIGSFKAFDREAYTSEQQMELIEIIEDATEHAEHIVKSPIDHQREHFKTLSIDITDMVAITGTAHTIYEQFCPMYDNGSTWLSTSDEIKNPYLGSKMVTCGKVQKEIK
tara:strand:+ start:389 stop:958 length:570 start_codon:yes stop_codon:yes gene_type:complete